MNIVISRAPKTSWLYKYRAVLHARAGKAEDATKDLAKFTELTPSASSKAYLDAVVAAHLGDDEQGMKRLEAALEGHSDDSGFLYDTTCAYSIAAAALAEVQAVDMVKPAAEDIKVVAAGQARPLFQYTKVGRCLCLDDCLNVGLVIIGLRLVVKL